jgi:hypothetical protein
LSIGGRNWKKLEKTGRNWGEKRGFWKKLEEIGRNWKKLEETGRIR